MEYDRGRVPYGGCSCLLEASGLSANCCPKHTRSSVYHTRCVRANKVGRAHLCSAVRVRGIGPTVGHAGGPAERYHDMLNFLAST